MELVLAGFAGLQVAIDCVLRVGLGGHRAAGAQTCYQQNHPDA
jgi:hypothetical protein